jgi:hypothetical protein
LASFGEGDGEGLGEAAGPGVCAKAAGVRPSERQRAPTKKDRFIAVPFLRRRTIRDEPSDGFSGWRFGSIQETERDSVAG